MEARTPPSAERKAFYGKIDGLHLAPLWEALHLLVTQQPQTPCVPYVWHYAQVRGHLMESGQLIGAQEAERRVLILENPGMPGQGCVTRTLFAGLQLVLPGEVAPSHRHVQTALRLIIEGHHAYTAVEGERIPMERGDFIITPAWAWHEHGNDTSQPMVWLDGLDIPMVRMFDAGFSEKNPQGRQLETRPSGDSRVRYGNNLKPVTSGAHAARPVQAYPLWHYPYSRSREVLEHMRQAQEWHPHFGLKMEFTNPVDGGPAMPTISAFIQLLPKGFASKASRSTDGTVIAVLEGRGTTYVGDQRLDWGPNDVLVVPSWHTLRHQAREDSVLFSYSDRGVQQKLGLWREELLD